MVAVNVKRKRKNNFDKLIRNILEVDNNPLIARYSKNLLENKKHPLDPLSEGEHVMMIRSKKIARVTAINENYVALITPEDGFTHVVGRYEVTRI